MFLSQQVKRNVIITNNGKYELTEELQKDVRLFQESIKLEPCVQSSSQNENIAILARSLLNFILNFAPIILQIMSGFYMECYTRLKSVKRVYSLPQIEFVKMFPRKFC